MDDVPASVPFPPPADFRTLFAEHAPFVWRTLRRLGLSPADVEDVSQEVFLVVHRRLADFDNRSGLRPWLYGICTRTASDFRRRAHVRREQVVEAVPDMGAPADQDRGIERQQALAQLEAILDRLDAKKREVFVLFELEEMSLAEVAAAVDCPLQTAYSRLQSARSAVQASFERSQARSQ